MVVQQTGIRRYGHLIGGEWVGPSSGEVITQGKPGNGRAS